MKRLYQSKINFIQMKIYTKTGDRGMTSLIGGKIVPKFNDRIEAYGTIDELISYIGLLRDYKETEHFYNQLLLIQDHLMISASILAADCDDCMEKLPALSDGDITFLETNIDTMEEVLPPLTSFILPGGHPVVSFCHIARNVCRRAERVSLKVAQEVEIDNKVLKYLNRLSDFLFVMARKLSYDMNVKEIPWKPEVNNID